MIENLFIFGLIILVTPIAVEHHKAMNNENSAD